MFSKTRNAKKVISVIITLAMIFSLFTCMSGLDAFAIDNTIKEVKSPIVGGTASVGGYPAGFYPTQHCECGNHYIDQEGNDAYAYGDDASACLYNEESGLGCDGTILEWTPFTNSTTLVKGGNFYLTKDTTCADQWTMPAKSDVDVHFDLNGFNYQRTTSGGGGGRIWSGTGCTVNKDRFTVTDTSAGKTGHIYGGYKNASTNAGGLFWAGSGKLDMAFYRMNAKGQMPNGSLAGGAKGGFLYTTTVGNTVAFFDCDIKECASNQSGATGSTQGGCLYLCDCNTYAENSSFEGTELKAPDNASNANQGGAVYLYTHQDKSYNYTFNNCHFYGGKVRTSGGCISVQKEKKADNTHVEGKTYATFNDCIIEDGEAGTQGGNIYNNGNLKINGGIIRNGKTPTNNGSNIYCGASTTVTDTQILGGEAGDTYNTSVQNNWGLTLKGNTYIEGTLTRGVNDTTAAISDNCKINKLVMMPGSAKLSQVDLTGFNDQEDGDGYINVLVVTDTSAYGALDRAIFTKMTRRMSPSIKVLNDDEGKVYRINTSALKSATGNIQEAEHYHCYCGDTACTNPAHEKMVFYPCTNAMRTATKANGGWANKLPYFGAWYLVDITTLSSQTTLNHTTAYICFNGKDVNITHTRGFQFGMNGEADQYCEMNLCDCVGTGGMHKEISEGNIVFAQGYYGADKTAQYWGMSSYSMNIYSGTYDFSKSQAKNTPDISFGGGAESVEFNMYGGTLKCCNTNNATGTAGQISVNGTFNMYGGTIELGTSKYTGTGDTIGGGILAKKEMNMYGGVIKGGTLDTTENTRTATNKKDQGGSIALTNSGATFNMTGGTIEGGKIVSGKKAGNVMGGNIFAVAGTTLNISGGDIIGGQITFDGVDASSTSKYTYGGNIASYGDLNISDNARILGGKILNGDGRVDAFGGNIAQMGETFTMTGGIVTGGEIPVYHDTTTNTDLGSFGGNIFVYNSGKNHQITGGVVGGEVTVGDTTYVGGKAKNGGNIQTGWGGAVQFTVAGDALITNGEAVTYGGNICTWGNSSLTVGGNAVITDGKATNGNGGNIFVHSDISGDNGRASTLTMTGGTIKNGSAIKVTTGGSGSNVFVSLKRVGKAVTNTPVFNMSGGKIDGGTGSGLVYVQGDFEMTGGEILGDGSTSSVVAGDTNANILIDGGKLVKAGNNNNKTFKITGESEVSSYAGSFSKPISLEGLTSTTEAVVSCTSPAIGKQLFTNLPTGYAGFISLDSTLAETYDLASDGKLALKTNTQCVCGGAAEDVTGHTCDKTTVFTIWTKTNELPTSGSYYLAKDVTVSATTTLTGDLNLDLNGHKIEKSEAVAIFEVPADTTFNLTDSVGGGKVDGKELEVTTDGGNIIVKGTMNLYGGEITGGKTTKKGGNIYVLENAFMNMYGGKVTDGAAGKGGNIALNYTKSGTYGTLTVNAGEISGGTATDRGDDVFAYDTAKINVNGGKVGKIYLSYRYDSLDDARDGATAKIAGGEVDEIYAFNGHTTVNVTGGTVTAIKLVSIDTSSGSPVLIVDEVSQEDKANYDAAQEIFNNYKEEDTGHFEYEIYEDNSTILNTNSFVAMDKEIGDNEGVREQMAKIVEDFVGDKTTFEDAVDNALEYNKALAVHVVKSSETGLTDSKGRDCTKFIVYSTIDAAGLTKDGKNGYKDAQIYFWLSSNPNATKTFKTANVYTSLVDVDGQSLVSTAELKEISEKSDYMFFFTITLPTEALINANVNITATTTITVEDGRSVSGEECVINLAELVK